MHYKNIHRLNQCSWPIFLSPATIQTCNILYPNLLCHQLVILTNPVDGQAVVFIEVQYQPFMVLLSAMFSSATQE